MGQVVQFRMRPRMEPEGDALALDLLSAVDFALRDLADLSNGASVEAMREQASACLAMLAEAYRHELEFGAPRY